MLSELLEIPASSLEAAHHLGAKILVSLVCGGLIGLERELKNKSAGVKTNMLICLGSMLFTAISVEIAASETENGVSGDPGRIAAQIVSGIGFLGGGAILQSKNQVVGLTTAATIWLVAAIGVWIGMGHLATALLISLTVIPVLISVRFLENRFLGRKRFFSLVIQLRGDSKSISKEELVNLLDSLELDLTDYRESPGLLEDHEIRISYHGRMTDHSRVLLELWKLPGVLDIQSS